MNPSRPRFPLPGSLFRIGGAFVAECLRPDGSLRWRDHAKNGVTTPGLNSALDVYFRAGSQLTAWYAGLIDAAGYSALAAADTISSHAGWAESVAYSNANRLTWSPAAASGGVLANGTAMGFLINATATLKGAFLVSQNSKGGTSGTLWCTALFAGGDRAVLNGDTLNLTYQLTAVSG